MNDEPLIVGPHYTASDIDELYKKLGREYQDAACKLIEPFIKKAIEIIESEQQESLK